MHDRIHDDPQLHTEKFQHDYIIKQKIQMSRCNHIREHDNYLDEEIKTVSARKAETFEAL